MHILRQRLRSCRAVRRAVAFTLIELLVVMSIIGILAAVGIPAMRSFRKGDTMRAAVRQLLDDAAYARQRALNDHTTVYMVFVPPVLSPNPPVWFSGLAPRERRLYLEHQMTSYALYVPRQAGDQPGRWTASYLTPWRTLPDGIFIAMRKFSPGHLAGPGLFDYATFDFPYQAFPYPKTNGVMIPLPSIAFDYQGSVTGQKNVVIPLARGSVMLAQDANGPIWSNVDWRESPLGNSTNTYNHVVIEWLTGRARSETPQIQ